MAPEAGDVHPDPGGIQTAIDRYRDLAKYLITIFAGVGALLVAGTQLASIGDLSFKDDPQRVIAAVLGLVLALSAVVAVVALALKVLRPVEMTFGQVLADSELRSRIEARSWLLGGAQNLDEVRDNIETAALEEADRETWIAVADDVVAHAAYLRTRAAFEGTWWPLLGAGIVGVIGITAFTWGANPPENGEAGPVAKPTPVEVRLSLTAAGREALADAFGGRACTTRPVPALAIGGTAEAPELITLPRGSCKAARFVLSSDWGAATRSG